MPTLAADIDCVIRIELFGVARLRAGAPLLEVRLTQTRHMKVIELGAVFDAIAAAASDLSAECLVRSEVGLELKPEYIVNVDGDRFIRQRADQFDPRRPLLLMTTDAGG